MVYMINPKTEEELNNIVLPKGRYKFEVLKSLNKISSTGNPMNDIFLGLHDDTQIGNVRDFLVFSDKNLNIRKVKHFCEATGLSNEYHKGQIRENFTGLTGEVDIDIEEKKPNGKGGFFPEKNIVVDYVKDDKKQALPESYLNDDIPF
jgi:hypothetical protein